MTPLSEEQDKSKSGAVPLKGASICHGKHSSKAGRVSSPWMEERVGKSPMAELLEDVVGAHALRHLWNLRLGKISLQAREKLHLL
jgi:hypothetical protein